jgi:hypothetical protein
LSSVLRIKCSGNPARTQSRSALCVSVKKPTRKWHIWFLPTHEPTLKKPKEPFFANARQKVDNFSPLLVFFTNKHSLFSIQKCVL